MTAIVALRATRHSGPGTRVVGRARSLGASLALATTAALCSASAAEAGKYPVLHCADSHRAAPGALEWEAPPQQYSAFDDCANDADRALKIRNVGAAAAGNYALWQWSAPGGAAIEAAEFRHRLNGASGHRARAYVVDFGGGVEVIAAGGSDEWTDKAWSGSGRAHFGVYLACQPDSGSSCVESNTAKAYVKNVRLTLDDPTAPSASGTGELLAGGWQRATRALEISGSDQGGGVRALEVQVNGNVLQTRPQPCAEVAGAAATLQPCASSRTESGLAINTAAAPFHNGANAVKVCAYDYATIGSANAGCSEYAVSVDNAAPVLRFRDDQDPDDPELIRASVSEPHSGLSGGTISYRRAGETVWQPLTTTYSGGASGELTARVDSEAVPEGRYEFQVTAQDRAGNSAESLLRADGETKTLSFPLRAQTQLRAHLGGAATTLAVGYGKASKASGRLVSESGDPIAFQTVEIAERYDPGALNPERVSEVVTDREGRFAAKLPPGPSRRVAVSYPGSPKYAADASKQLDLNVRSGASLKTSAARVRAGRAVQFRGAVRHGGAVMPPGGKLVELQVREGARSWGTVGEAFATSGNGRFRLPYRFGRFYTRPTTFGFRVKVTKEQRWPFKAPTRSRARQVTILPDRGG